MESHGFNGIHLIPWIPLDSMEFYGIHGIPCNPWNSMVFLWNGFHGLDGINGVQYLTVQCCAVLYNTVLHEFHGIPWSRWNPWSTVQYCTVHGILWDFMEFHGIHGI